MWESNRADTRDMPTNSPPRAPLPPKIWKDSAQCNTTNTQQQRRAWNRALWVVSYVELIYRNRFPTKCTCLQTHNPSFGDYWNHLQWESIYNKYIQGPPKKCIHTLTKENYVVKSIIVNLQYISVNTTIWYMYLLQYNIYSYSSYMFRLLWVIFRH